MPDSLPPVSIELARRAEGVIRDWTAAVVRWAGQQPGNPLGAEVREHGGATALMVRRSRTLGWANMVTGLGDEHHDALPDIVEPYRAAGLACNYHVTPADLTGRLARALHAQGLYQSQFTTTLCRVPAPSGSAPAAVRVRDATSDGDVHRFADLWIAGYELRDRSEAARAELLRLFRTPGVRLAIAETGGMAAAAGCLFTSGGVAYLAGAATLPGSRRAGCQAALIRHRLQAAREAGCDLVTVTTGFATASKHNLERAGFRVVHTKAIWTDSRPGPAA